MIAKHRNGPTGSVALFFKKELAQFLEAEVRTQGDGHLLMHTRRRLAAVLVPAGVGLLAFAVYLCTLLPSVGWGDIARFQYVARVWGIPHRFGYPLYIALSRLFGYLPVGDLAYRVNLMSAVFAALAAVMVCFIVMRPGGTTGSRPRRRGCPLPFRGRFGARRSLPRSIRLNAFLIGAVLLVLLAWQQTRKIGLLYLGIGLYALSFGNHMTVVTLAPAVLYLILVTDYRVLLDLKNVAIMAGLMLLGALQYLYVILRAQQQPLLNELGPFSWRGWIHWMTRNRFPGQFFGFTAWPTRSTACASIWNCWKSSSSAGATSWAGSAPGNGSRRI